MKILKYLLIISFIALFSAQSFSQPYQLQSAEQKNGIEEKIKKLIK